MVQEYFPLPTRGLPLLFRSDVIPIVSCLHLDAPSSCWVRLRAPMFKSWHHSPSLWTGRSCGVSSLISRQFCLLCSSHTFFSRYCMVRHPDNISGACSVHSLYRACMIRTKCLGGVIRTSLWRVINTSLRRVIRQQRLYILLYMAGLWSVHRFYGARSVQRPCMMRDSCNVSLSRNSFSSSLWRVIRSPSLKRVIRSSSLKCMIRMS